MTNALSAAIVTCIKRAVEEDMGDGDATTNSIVPPDATLQGKIVAKQSGVVAGVGIVAAVFHQLDRDVVFRTLVEDGASVLNRTTLADLDGSARALLTGERAALNFLGRMSGIATLTKQFVDAVKGTGAHILDTRKTAPGLRTIDKRAVQIGGGMNHRTR